MEFSICFVVIFFESFPKFNIGFCVFRNKLKSLKVAKSKAGCAVWWFVVLFVVMVVVVVLVLVMDVVVKVVMVVVVVLVLVMDVVVKMVMVVRWND